MRSLYGAASVQKDAVLLTPKSTLEKPRVKLKAGQPVPVKMLSFSVDRGVRVGIERFLDADGEHFKYEGKWAYKEIEASNSRYETSVMAMFEMAFGKTKNPKNDMKLFWSFVGVVQLMKKYLDKKQQKGTVERFMDLIWHPSAQELERDSAETDFKIKDAAFQHMIKELGLKSLQKKADKRIDDYYAKYGTRKNKAT